MSEKANLQTLGTFALDEILDEYEANEYGTMTGPPGLQNFRRREWREHGYYVKMNSKRMRCFANSQKCFICGLQACHFKLQRMTDNPDHRAHFNLFGKDPITASDILFTIDHFVPKSRGGGNGLDNLITMCVHCNSAKGSTEFVREEVRSGVIKIRIANGKAKANSLKFLLDTKDSAPDVWESRSKRYVRYLRRIQWLESVLIEIEGNES